MNPITNKRNQAASRLGRMSTELGSTEGNSDVYNNVKRILNEVYGQLKSDVDTLSMFFISIFMMIAVNRQHKALLASGIKEKYGESKRNLGRYFMRWLRETDAGMALRFVSSGVMAEYTCWETVMPLWNKGDRNKPATILFRPGAHPSVIAEEVALFMTGLIWKQMSFKDKQSFAKYMLPKIKTGTTQVHRLKGKKTYGKMKPETIAVNKFRLEYSLELSKKLNLFIMEKDTVLSDGRKVRQTLPVGYEQLRKSFNKNKVRTLFSTKEITAFEKARLVRFIEGFSLDRMGFIQWLTQLSSGERFFLKNCLEHQMVGSTTTRKYEQLYQWYQMWMEGKDQARKKLVELEKKVARGETVTTDELKDAQKQAKINVGAEDILTIMFKLASGSLNEKESNLMFEQLMRDMGKLRQRVLVIRDCSSSMGTRRQANKGITTTAQQFATFITALIIHLTPEGGNRDFWVDFAGDASVMGRFSKLSTGSRYDYDESKIQKPISKIGGDTFLETYRNVSSMKPGIVRDGTLFHTVNTLFKGLEKSVAEEFYGRNIWLVVSDGDINSSNTAADSIKEALDAAEKFSGVRPSVILWNTCTGADNSQYDMLGEMMLITGTSISTITNIFSRFTDMTPVNEVSKWDILLEEKYFKPILEVVKGEKSV